MSEVTIRKSNFAKFLDGYKAKNIAYWTPNLEHILDEAKYNIELLISTLDNLKKEKEIVLPAGFRFAGVHCGIKDSKKDLSVVVCDAPSVAAGVYTQNLVRAACIDWNRDITPSSQVKGVVGRDPRRDERPLRQAGHHHAGRLPGLFRWHCAEHRRGQPG